MPQFPIRLAILEADTPLPRTKQKFGGYGGVFEFLLKRGARALGPGVLDPDKDLVVEKRHVEGDDTGNLDGVYPDLDDIDAILITGSRHDSFADTPWINKLVAYTAKALAHPKVRIIGVCFGHQIVGRAMNAPVGRNEKGWEAAVNQVQLTPKGKELFGGRDTLAIHQMHRDVVYALPSPIPSTNIELLGSSPACAVQGMYTPKKLLTVQGHPEFTQEIMEEILETRRSTGIFDDEAYEEHIKKVGLGHDGVVVSQAFLRFLMGD